MKHEVALPLIEELLHGRLSGKTRQDVLSHVRSCEECRSLSETYSVLSEAWDDGDREHPSSEVIVEYAVGEDALDDDTRSRVAAHLLECDSCAREVDETDRAEAALSREAATPADRPPEARDRIGLLAPAIAAGIVLLLLAYPAYLGLFEMPGIKGRLSALESGTVQQTTPDWSGPVRRVILQSPLRGDETDLPAADLGSGAPYVSLEVVPGMLEEYAGARFVRFEIRDSSGRRHWSWECSETELRSITEEGVIRFLVPTADLPTGRLKLLVSRDGAAAGVVFERSFLVERDE
jgi:hypothetical protein